MKLMNSRRPRNLKNSKRLLKKNGRILRRLPKKYMLIMMKI
jgi:hypothetical protein